MCGFCNVRVLFPYVFSIECVFVLFVLCSLYFSVYVYLFSFVLSVLV